MTADDDRWMARAIALAEKFRGRTAPNPHVGCVIVKAGEVVGEGAHAGPGKPHAEIVALRKAGARTKGATMYVTLEPCTHHGRTPPCAPVVRDAKLARVVVGSEDPVPGHGGGIELLRRAKISVGRALVAECDATNRGFLTWAMYKRPAFTLKAAVTLDGKIATISGESQWITGEAARADVHRMRDMHDAVLVGVGTVLADDPRLSSRLPKARDPIRIVIDSQLRTPADARLLPRGKPPRTIIATTESAPEKAERALVRAGAEVWRLDSTRGRVRLEALATRLGEEGVLSVLVEGGGEVHASFLAARLANELVLYVAPKVVGGKAPSWVGGAGLAKLASAYRFRFAGPPVLVGDDLRLVLVSA
jgi:diaminohydroxyphosphoribosylaminopyrimidine deaminase/5-amino-6-(5-phosphoribosylamino)uracil reductase